MSTSEKDILARLEAESSGQAPARRKPITEHDALASLEDEVGQAGSAEDQYPRTPPEQPHESVLPRPQTGDAFDLSAAGGVPKAPAVPTAEVPYTKPLPQKTAAGKPSLLPTGKAPTAPVDAATPSRGFRSTHDDIATAIAEAFVGGATPGVIDHGVGVEKALLDRDPNMMGKQVLPGGRVSVGTFHQLPGAPTSMHREPIKVGDVVDAAAAAGMAAKESAYMAAFGPVASKLAGLLGAVVPDAATAAMPSTVARLTEAITSRLGVPREIGEQLAGATLKTIRAGSHGAATGGAFGAMHDVAEGEPITASSVGGMAAAGAVLDPVFHGLTGGLTDQPLSFSKAAAAPVDATRARIFQKGGADPYSVLGVASDATDAEINAAWKNHVVKVRNSGATDAEAMESSLNAARTRIREMRAAEKSAADNDATAQQSAANPAGQQKPEQKAPKADEVPEPQTGKPDVAATEDIDEPLPESKPTLREKIADVIDPARKQKVTDLENERRAAVRAAETDALTGLGNLAAFQKARATAESDPGMAFIAFDANNFKKINDLHGHTAGNEVLQHFSNVIKSVSPRGFRTGGDEFVAIVPADQAEMVRDQIEAASEGSLRGTRTSLTGTIGLTYDEADQQLQARKAIAKQKLNPVAEEVAAPDAGVAEQVQQGVAAATEQPEVTKSSTDLSHDRQAALSTEPSFQTIRLQKPLAEVTDDELTQVLRHIRHSLREHTEGVGPKIGGPEPFRSDIELVRAEIARRKGDATSEPSVSPPAAAEVVEPQTEVGDVENDMPPVTSELFPHHKPRPEFIDEMGHDQVSDPDTVFGEIVGHHNAAIELQNRAHEARTDKKRMLLSDEAKAARMLRDNMLEEYENQYGEEAADDMRRELKLTTKADTRRFEQERAERKKVEDAESLERAKQTAAKPAEHPFLERTGKVVTNEHGNSHAEFKDIVKAGVYRAVGGFRGGSAQVRQAVESGGSYADITKALGEVLGDGGSSLDGGFVNMKGGQNPRVEVENYTTGEKTKLNGKKLVEMVREMFAPDVTREAPKPAEKPAAAPTATAENPLDLGNGRKAYKDGDAWHVWNTKLEKYVEFRKGEMFDAMEKKLAEQKPADRDPYSPPQPSKWVPSEYPWRVTTTVQSSVASNYGWATNTKVFPTEEAAREYLTLPFRKGEVERELMRAKNAETWTRNGSWANVPNGKFKRGSKPTVSPDASLGEGARPKDERIPPQDESKAEQQPEPEAEQQPEEPKEKKKSRLKEEADKARERIKARGKRLLSGLDPEEFADYVLISADMIVDGTRAVADWTKAMVDEFGEGIRAHLGRIRNAALKLLEEGAVPEGMDAGLAQDAHEQWQTVVENADITGAKTDLEKMPEPAAKEPYDFDAWFEGSKAADKDGKPLVLHHQSHSEKIEGFDRHWATRTFNRNPERMDTIGIWFTNLEEEFYGPYAHDVNLSIKNPYVFPGEHGDDDLFNAAHKKATEFRNDLIAKGYDGVRIPDSTLDSKKQDVWIAFEPDQIRQLGPARKLSETVAPAEPKEDTKPDPTDRLIDAIGKLTDKIDNIGAKPAGDISTESRPGESNASDTAEGSDRSPAVEVDRGGEAEGGGPGEVRGAEAGGGAVDKAGPADKPSADDVRKSGEPDNAAEPGPAGGVGTAKRTGKRGARRTDAEHVEGETPAENPEKIRGENYRIQPSDLEDLGGPKGRANQNLEAISIARQLTAEGRPATIEEQQKLVKFVGWGGLADMFPVSGYVPSAGGYVSNYVKPEWRTLSDQLKTLLSPEEYETARRSTQYAHYTSPEVIKGMYDALKHLGVAGSIAAIEPGAGVGHFIGLSPFEARFTAIEMDHLSAEILGHLYPHANLIRAPYQTVVLPDNSVDVAIGNPPFKGGAGIKDRKYGKVPLKLHDYFFVKSLDKVRPGGLLAFVTSTGTLDKAGRGARQFMADRADFLGAIRLPGDAFKKNAATEVTTDIIFMRKRAPTEPANHVAPWMKQKEIQTPQGQHYPVNEYFADHPDMVLGDWVRDKLSMSDEARAGVKSREGEVLSHALYRAIEKLPKDVYAPQGPAVKGKKVGNAPAGAKEGQWVVQKGKISRVVEGSLEDTGLDPKSKTGARVAKLVALGDAARAVIDANTVGASDADLSKAQKTLTKLYDAFVKENGPINLENRSTTKDGTEVKTFPNLSRYNDPVNGPLVQSLERYDPATGSATKTPIHSKRLFSPPLIVDKVDAAWKGLVASLNEYGRVDMDYISKLYGKPIPEILNELGDQVFLEPMSGHYQPAQQYLSGNVKEKLALAREMAAGDPSLQKNIAALEKAQPKDVTPKQMREQGAAGVGATWIEPKSYQHFMEDVFGMMDPKISYRELDGSYAVTKGQVRSIAKYQEWGTSDVDAIDLFRDMLNGRQTTVYGKDGDGKKFVDKAATELAQNKQMAIQKRFEQWMFDDHAGRTDELVQRYNDLMNNTVVAQWDGSHLDGNMPGMAVEFRGKPMKLAQHQLNVIYQYLTNGNTLIAHEVGAGKTIAMAAMGMEAKRMGLVKKPMHVVNNVEQIARELLEVYPGAKILVADDYNFDAKRRREFTARIAADDWDAVIISHSSLKLIPNDPKFAQGIVSKILAEYEEALENAKADQQDRHTVKGLEKAIESYQEQLNELMDIQHQDNVVYFQQLGVDMLIVDEAHEFKNLPLPSAMKGISFAKAQKTVDLYMKTRHIENVNPGRGLVFATATPISNSIAEMYTMMRYLAESDLIKRGYRSFDAWAHDHIASWQEDEFTAIGTMKPVFRPRAYRNTFAMAQMFRSIADVKTRENLNLPTPPLVGGKPEEVIIPGSDRLRKFMKSLQKRWDNRPPRPEKGDDGVFPIMNDGRFGSIDAQLVTSKHARAAGHDSSTPWKHSKAEAVAREVFKIWEETKAVRGTQMIFSDLGVPKDLRATDNEALRKKLRDDPELVALDDKEIDALVDELTGGQSGYDLYSDIKNRLVKLGVPENEVEFIQTGGSNKKKRQAIVDRLKSGQTRVLIGSTPMMGQGVNAQDRMVALHHVDVPYKPAWLDQRDGRIVRQGNLLYDNMENGVHKPLIDGVRIKRYILKGSYDPKAWQILENKIGFIHQAMTARADTGMVEEVGGDATITPKDAYAIIKAEGSDNPYAMDFARSSARVKSLELEKSEYGDMEFRRRQQISHLRELAKKYQVQAADAARDAAKIPDLSGDKFTITIGDKVYTDRKEAGPQLLARIKALQTVWEKTVSGMKDEKIATFAGMPLYLDYLPWHTPKFSWSLRGIQSYSGNPNIAEGTSGVGLISSLENLLDRIKTGSSSAQGMARQAEQEIKDIAEQMGKQFPKEAELAQEKEKFKDLEKKMKEYKPADDDAAAPTSDEEDDESGHEDDDDGVMGSPRQFNNLATPDLLPDFMRSERPVDPVLGSPAVVTPPPQIQTPPQPATGEPVSAPQVMHQLARITAAAYEAMGKPGKVTPIRTGHMGLRKWALGQYSTHAHVIRTRTANDISTGAHEVAHAIEHLIYGWPKGSPWKGPMISGKAARELVQLGKDLYGSRKPVGGYKREGFAEFVRMYITGVDQRGKFARDVSVMAPEFHKWFEGTFLSNQQGVAQELEAARGMARQWYGQTPKERALMSIAQKSGIDLQKEKLDKVRRFFSKANHLDSAQPIYDLVVDAERQLGKPLPVRDNPYIATAALRLTHTARAAYMVNTAMIDLAGNPVGPPLADIRALVEGRRMDFAVYLWARRTIALYQDPVGREQAAKAGRPFTPRNSGLSVDDAIDLYNDLDSPQFEQAAGMVYEWNRGVRQYAAQASPMFADINDAIEKRDPGNYVPLKREFDELEQAWKSSGATKSSFTKKLKGSGRRVLDLFESMISQAEATVRAAHQNVVIEQIAKLERIEGVGDLIEEVPIDQVPAASQTIGDLVKQINRKIYDMDPTAPLLKFDDPNGQGVSTDITDAMVTFFHHPYSPKPGTLIVPVKRADGIHWYQVNKPLYDNLMGMDVYRLPGIMDVLFGKPVRMLRAGTTGLRASFGLVWNTMRDVQTFMVNSQGDDAHKLLYYWTGAMRDSFAHQLGAGTSDYMDAYLRLGGNMAQSLGQDMSHTRRAARQLFQGRSVKVLDPHNWFDFYRELISSPEAAPRAAEIRAVAKQVGWAPGQPMSIEQSWQMLLAAKQVTTDFTAAGNFSRVMNQIVPFYNSAIQGPRATARAFGRNKGKVMRRGLALAMASLALWALHKDEEWYKEMDWVDRFTNWHFPFEFNGNKYLLRIPRAFDIGLVFAAMPEAMADTWYRKDPEAAEKWVKTFVKAMNPIGLPPVMGEAADQLANKDLYFDTPIVPGAELQRPNPEQFNEYTSRMAIRLGEILNVSPRRIDHAIKGLAGPAAGDVLKWLGLGPKGVEREKELADTPLFGRMFPRGGQESGNGISVDKLFDTLEKARKIQHSTRTPETDEQKDARLILEDAAKAVAAASYVRTRTSSFAQRSAMNTEIRQTARDALAAYKEALATGTANRGEFQTLRHNMQFSQDSTRRVQEGKPLPRRKRYTPPPSRKRRPRNDE